VLRTLRAQSLKPHQTRTYKVSRDPAFGEKVEDVVALYLNPPAHALVPSLDEKTQIQALERAQLPLPLRTGRAVRHTHDYKRNGAVDLYAALEVATGRVTHACTDSHTAADTLGFLKKVARSYPHEELHVILDNSGAVHRDLRRRRERAPVRGRRGAGGERSSRATFSTRDFGCAARASTYVRPRGFTAMMFAARAELRVRRIQRSVGEIAPGASDASRVGRTTLPRG
jgi:hypothetical protein